MKKNNNSNKRRRKSRSGGERIGGGGSEGKGGGGGGGGKKFDSFTPILYSKVFVSILDSNFGATTNHFWHIIIPIEPINVVTIVYRIGTISFIHYFVWQGTVVVFVFKATNSFVRDFACSTLSMGNYNMRIKINLYIVYKFSYL